MGSKSEVQRRLYFSRTLLAGVLLASLASILLVTSPTTQLSSSASLSTMVAAAALGTFQTSAWVAWGATQVSRSLTPEAFGIYDALEENVYHGADDLIWALWETEDWGEEADYYYNIYFSSNKKEKEDETGESPSHSSFDQGDDSGESSSSKTKSLGGEEKKTKKKKKKKKPMEMEVIPVESLMREGFAPDLSRPFRIPGLMPTDLRMVDLIREKPYGDLVIDYFTDARQVNTVPDGKASIREIATNISQGNSYAKFGSEMLFREHPELLSHLPLDRVKKVTGEGYIDASLIGDFLTIPVFMAHGHEGDGADGGEGGRATPRTDLHCEPIANVVLQVSGSKLWTLYPSESSRFLRPKISPDGRAYVFSARDPADEDLQTIDRYSVVLNKGDAMFLPSWTWHRVDYLPGITALSVSFFHVRIKDMFTNNPIFALATFPNMMKEFFGIKMQ
mmetsp:Transcript_16925/g.27503  ORF Transcript_16925/g.27503 Transcript_16925/m.27503 type:complete len:449 (+) Transcript_16925:176-1522(+)